MVDLKQVGKDMVKCMGIAQSNIVDLMLDDWDKAAIEESGRSLTIPEKRDIKKAIY